MHQGVDAVALVAQRQEENPFQVAFIDIRMPPGIDGKETARRIRAIDPMINLVIVSGYSDFTVTDIASVAGPADKIYYISKPFAADEVRQMALALSQRWESDARHVTELRAKLIELAVARRGRTTSPITIFTSAPNRMAFQHKLNVRLAHARTPFVLVALDLDRFKQVNDTSEVTDCNVTEVIASSLSAARHANGARIAIECEFDRPTFMVRANRVLMAQVIVNLLTNASELIAAKRSEGGLIRVRQSASDCDTGEVVAISITDDGEGF